MSEGRRCEEVQGENDQFLAKKGGLEQTLPSEQMNSVSMLNLDF